MSSRCYTSVVRSCWSVHFASKRWEGWKSEKDEDNYTSTSPGEFYCLIYSIVEIAVLEGKFKVVRVRWSGFEIVNVWGN